MHHVDTSCFIFWQTPSFVRAACKITMIIDNTQANTNPQYRVCEYTSLNSCEATKLDLDIARTTTQVQVITNHCNIRFGSLSRRRRCCTMSHSHQILYILMFMSCPLELYHRLHRTLSSKLQAAVVTVTSKIPRKVNLPKHNFSH